MRQPASVAAAAIVKIAATWWRTPRLARGSVSVSNAPNSPPSPASASVFESTTCSLRLNSGCGNVEDNSSGASLRSRYSHARLRRP